MHAASVTISDGLTWVNDHAPASSDSTAARAPASQRLRVLGSAVRNAVGIALRSASARTMRSPSRRALRGRARPARLVDEAAHGRVDRLREEELQARAVKRAQRLRGARRRSRAASTAIVTFSSAPRSVARRSGVPIQHSAPAASIAARPASVRVVMRTACPSSTIAAARRRPLQPPPTIRIRATAAHLTRRGPAPLHPRGRERSTTIRCPP